MGEKVRLRVAWIGARGIPADQPGGAGGERETEEKSVRIAQKGHEVIVYTRRHYNPEKGVYRGVRLIPLPSLKTLTLDTITHSLLACLHVILFNTADVIHFMGMGNGLFVPLVKLARKKAVILLDGLDWERPKWGPVAKIGLKLAARLVFRYADAVYTDTQFAQEQFTKLFGRCPLFIPQGADVPDPGASGEEALKKYGLERRKYILFVAYLYPEKGAHLLVEAFQRIETDMKLVIVGDVPYGYARDYVDQLKRVNDPRIIFPGFVYGIHRQQLYNHCYAFVQPFKVSGCSMTLLAAMGFGCCVLANGNPENEEVMRDAGLTFAFNDVEDLRRKLQWLIDHPDEAEEFRERAKKRVQEIYNWDKIADQLEDILLIAAQGKRA